MKQYIYIYRQVKLNRGYAIRATDVYEWVLYGINKLCLVFFKRKFHSTKANGQAIQVDDPIS